MNKRPVPRVAVDDIVAMVILEPSGVHQVEVAVPSEVFGMKFQLRHLDQLEQICASARRIIAAADGGPEYHNRRVIPIEVSR